MSDDSDYDVGYCKPPVATRFQPGDGRGNRKGRPKKSVNLKTDLKQELSETIILTENGRPKRITKQRAMLKALVVRAIKGDTRATAKLFDLLLRLTGIEEEMPQGEPLSAEDQAILTAILNRDSGDSDDE